MSKGAFLIPFQAKRGLRRALDWVINEQNALRAQGFDIEKIQSTLTPLLSLRSLPKSQNPWVMVELRWNGAYADIEEDYLCKLSDWLFVSACVKEFCLDDRAGKHSEVHCSIAEHYQARWATDEDIQRNYRDIDYWALFKGEETPTYRHDAKAALKRAFKDWAPMYDPEVDAVPAYNAFHSVFQETMRSIPCRGVLIVKQCLDYGRKGYSGSPFYEDACLEFEDMRQAALMVVSEAKIIYKTDLYDPQPIDFAARTKIKTYFDDNNDGYMVEWEPDARQWAQMQEECPPRCEWKEMVRCAQGVVKQKRLKKDTSRGVEIEK